MRALNVLIALGALVTVLALVISKRRSLRAPGWLLLRSLFPSWRFFESIGPALALSYRSAIGGGELGPWQEALPPVPRTALSLVFNPRGNLRLASQSLVERLLDDLESLTPEQAPHSVSYQLVQSLICGKLGALPGAEERRYQFRLTLPEGAEECVFVSEVHTG